MTRNIAYTAAIADVTSNGYFEFYDSDMYENYAYQTPVASILDSRLTSIISNCQIHSNRDLYNTWAIEINDACDKTCSVPEQLRTYYRNSGALTYSDIRAESLFIIVSSSLKLQQHTIIYNQNTIINMFLSDVELIDSVVEDVDINTTSFRITSSTCAFKNLVFNNISQNGDSELLLVNLDSSIIIDFLNFTDSNSSLLISRNSIITINRLYAENIKSDKSIIQISESEYTKIDDIQIANAKIINQQPIVLISDSIKIEISNINARNNKGTLISLVSSTFDSIDNAIIQN